MPKSTIAVSLLAVFLLGLLVGQHVAPRVADAGPTEIGGKYATVMSTGGERGEFATLWEFRDGKVARATQYGPGMNRILFESRLELAPETDAKPSK